MLIDYRINNQFIFLKKYKNKKNELRYDFKCKDCGSIIKNVHITNIKKINSCKKRKECIIKEKEKFLKKEIQDFKIIKIEQIGGFHRSLFYIECKICKTIKKLTITELYDIEKTKHKNCYLGKRCKNQRLNIIYHNIKDRCENPNNSQYKNYGGRGIKNLFNGYIEFEKLLYESYIEHSKIHGEKNTTIERIDVNGNYEINNVKWDTPTNQAKNKRNSFIYYIFKDNKKILKLESLNEIKKKLNLTCNISWISICINKNKKINDYYIKKINKY